MLSVRVDGEIRPPRAEGMLEAGEWMERKEPREEMEDVLRGKKELGEKD